LAPASAFAIPEETLLQYLHLTNAGFDLFASLEKNVQPYCRAYDLLATATRSEISRNEFVNYLWNSVVSLQRGTILDVQLSPAIYDDTKTVAKITANVQVRELGGRRNVTQVVTLVREAAGWRVLISDASLAALKQALRSMRIRPLPCGG
jgi:hypothetical protein